MGRTMEIGKTIQLTSKNQNITVTIENPIGSGGGSCVAYYVTYSETDNVEHRAVLKEFCPLYLGTKKEAFRDKNDNLIIPENLCDEYNRGLENFIETYKKINDYLLNTFSASNSHPTQIGLFFANNTAYTLTAADYGKSYDKIENNSLLSELKIVLAVTKAVELYHSAGYLHLDIKPQNVLILNEVKDLIKLFDYDSLVGLDEVKSGYHVPDTGLYYVPEIQSRNFRRIGIHTDIFEIASMLYSKIFGMVPTREQMASDYHYDFDNVALLKGISPKALFELETLFKNTLQISYLKRYQTTEEFKRQLEKIIGLVDSNAPYLINLPKWQPSAFSIGREQELRDIRNLLQETGFVMIKAMGGMGKSELAKMYAKQYGDEYHTVQFCKYTGSLKALVASISIKGINDTDYENLDRLAKVKNDILHDCDNHTLIIIDNYNVTYDEYSREFLPADNSGFKVIFTTRCEPAQEYLANKVYELTTLPKEACQQLFYLHSKLEIAEERNIQINTLLDVIDCNTLVLVLLAKSIKATKTELGEVLHQLEQSRLEDVSGKVFHEYDYSSVDGDNYNKVFSHLNTIFSISRLTKIQTELLLCLSLVSNLGIEVDEFIKDCENEQFTKSGITDLINYGWIEQEETNWISLHTVVSDLIFANKSIVRGKSYDGLSYNIINQCNSFGDEHIDMMNVMFSYLFHLDKRIGSEIEFRSIDVKLYLSKLYFNLYMPKEANKKLEEAEEIIAHSFRYKPRLCQVFWLKGDIENEFGNPEKAITLYETAISYCKKTVNCYYDERLRSIIGIAEACSKLHHYEKAYKYYLDAYNYIHKDSFKEKLNSKFFVTNNYGTKELYAYIPNICDGIIEVCIELQLPNEIERFKKIKGEFEIEENPVQDALDLFAKGNIKEGTRLFFEKLEEYKGKYGEDSPLYKKILNDAKPLLVIANADDDGVSVRPIVESLEHVRNTYGKLSYEYFDLLEMTLPVLLEVGEFEFAKSLAQATKVAAKSTMSKDSYFYQSTNLMLISVEQFRGNTPILKTLIEEINPLSFKSKSEIERLVKIAGIAMYQNGFEDLAASLAEKVFKLDSPETSSYFFACIILSWHSIEQKEFEKVLFYLNSGKKAIDQYDDGFIKDEYYYSYYATLAKYYSELDDDKMAVSTIDEYLKMTKGKTGYSQTFLICRAISEKSVYLRYLGAFDNAYTDLKNAVELLEHIEGAEVIKEAVYGNYAICCIHNDMFNEGYDYIERFISLYSNEMKISNYDYIDCILYFIDALILKQDTSFYHFIEEAKKVIADGEFEKTLHNAKLKNYIGVVLGDYEEAYGLAKNYCEEAKNILDELQLTETPLYKQVLSNIEYADKKNWDSLIKGLASAYADDKNDEEE